MKPLEPIRCLSLVSLALALLVAADARAGGTHIFRVFSANATSYCQAALPVFDGNIRKRPLAVQNEGAEAAFVTCAFTAQSSGLGPVTVIAANTGSSDATLTCTGVTGYNTGSNEYASKTIVVPASGWQGMQWTGADFDGAPALIPGSGLFGISCKLPPGVGIGNSSVSFSEDIGN